MLAYAQVRNFTGVTPTRRRSQPTRHGAIAVASPPTAAPALQRFETWLQAHPLAASVCLYALAVALRALHWWTFRDNLAARVFLMDEAYYHEETLNLVRGLPNASDSYFMTPIYPLFLGLVFRVAGDAVSVVYALQLGLGAPFLEGTQIDEEPDPFHNGNGEMILALGTHLVIAIDFLAIHNFPAMIALEPHAFTAF